jgi:hypothetical protein
MKKKLVTIINCLSLLTVSVRGYSASALEDLLTIEKVRLDIRQNHDAGPGERETLKDLTNQTQAILSGKTHGINFKASASESEREQVRKHILNTYIIRYKSLYGEQKDTSWQKFNQQVFGCLQEDWLDKHNPHRAAYISHLAALYVMGLGAFQLVKAPRFYFEDNNRLKAKIFRVIDRKLLPPKKGTSKIHSLMETYFNDALINQTLQKQIDVFIGDHFYQHFLSLTHQLADIPEIDKHLIQISQIKKQSLANFLKKHPEYKWKSSLNCHLSDEDSQKLSELGLNLVRSNSSSGQSVHHFNNQCIPGNRDTILAMGEKYFQPQKNISIEDVKNGMYQYINDNKNDDFDRVENSVRHHLAETFQRLDNHLSTQGKVEKHETMINVPEMMSMVWDVLTHLQQVKEEKQHMMVDRLLQQSQNINFFPSHNQKKYRKDFQRILEKLNTSDQKELTRFINTFAENIATGGGCYPGIAGRLFSEYCYALLNFFRDEDSPIIPVNQLFQNRIYRGR